MKNFLFALGLISIVSFSSCSKDEEVIADYRGMIEGTYNYTSTVYFADGSSRPNDGQITIAKSSSNQNFVQVTIDGEIFIGSKITGDDTGVAFDLEPRELVDGDGDGDGVEVRGVPSYIYEGVKYHALYNAANNKLTFAIEADYIKDEYDQYNTVVIAEATKR